MISEIELFFDSVVHEDRNVLDLMTADYTFVNERLARHYGIPGHLRQPVPPRHADRRCAARACLGKGAILLVTSHAHRTSPVLRGKWVLENILGVSPRAAARQRAGARATSRSPRNRAPVREALEQHRANPTCAAATA